jgi:aminopeptidase YwaD
LVLRCNFGILVDLMKLWIIQLVIVVGLWGFGVGYSQTKDSDKTPKRELKSLDLHRQELLARVTKKQLKTYSLALEKIGPRPTSNAKKTAETVAYLQRTLESMGYATTTAVGKKTRRMNVIAEIRGVTHPEQVIELGAHYDTVAKSPGADDNGSGVAGVLAVANALRDVPMNKTLRFVFYAAEEIGTVGSKSHVRRVLANKNETLVGAIVFEMIGYTNPKEVGQKVPAGASKFNFPTKGDFIAVGGHGKAAAAIATQMERVIKNEVPELPAFFIKERADLLPDGKRSDHAPYWAAKLPAIVLTDTANFRNPNYHRPTDTVSTLNFEFLQKVTQATLGTIVKVAERNESSKAAPQCTVYMEYLMGRKRR